MSVSSSLLLAPGQEGKVSSLKTLSDVRGSSSTRSARSARSAGKADESGSRDGKEFLKKLLSKVGKNYGQDQEKSGSARRGSDQGKSLSRAEGLFNLKSGKKESALSGGLLRSKIGKKGTTVPGKQSLALKEESGKEISVKGRDLKNSLKKMIPGEKGPEVKLPGEEKTAKKKAGDEKNGTVRKKENSGHEDSREAFLLHALPGLSKADLKMKQEGSAGDQESRKKLTEKKTETEHKVLSSEKKASPEKLLFKIVDRRTLPGLPEPEGERKHQKALEAGEKGKGEAAGGPRVADLTHHDLSHRFDGFDGPKTEGTMKDGISVQANGETHSASENSENFFALKETEAALQKDLKEGAPASGSLRELSSLSDHLRRLGNHRIARSIAVLLKDGRAGEIRLLLKPESLGSVRIRMNLNDGNIAGKIIVQSPQVQEIFHNNMSHLSRSLEEQGFRSASFDVYSQDENSREFKEREEEKKPYYSKGLREIRKKENFISVTDGTRGINLVI